MVSFRDLLLVNRLRSGLPVNQRAPSLDRRRTNVIALCVNDLFGSVVVCFVCPVTWYWARRASGYLLTGLVWVSARFAPDCVCVSRSIASLVRVVLVPFLPWNLRFCSIRLLRRVLKSEAKPPASICSIRLLRQVLRHHKGGESTGLTSNRAVWSSSLVAVRVVNLLVRRSSSRS